MITVKKNKEERGGEIEREEGEERKKEGEERRGEERGGEEQLEYSTRGFRW